MGRNSERFLNLNFSGITHIEIVRTVLRVPDSDNRKSSLNTSEKNIFRAPPLHSSIVDKSKEVVKSTLARASVPVLSSPTVVCPENSMDESLGALFLKRSLSSLNSILFRQGLSSSRPSLIIFHPFSRSPK